MTPDAGRQRLQRYYEANPRMVSSPFGGVDGIDAALLRDVFARLGVDFAGARVLDAGCGRGFTGGLVRELGGVYLGVDIVVSRAGFPLAQADAAALPVATASVDRVLCFDAYEHLPEPAAATAEFFRVLRPGGVLFLSAPNYGNVAGLVKWWCERFGAYERDSWAPFGRWLPQEREHLLTARRVRRLFRDAGFVPGRRIGHGPEVGLGLFPWLDHPRAPDAVRFRLQKVFAAVGPGVARVAPGASLHAFWRFDKPAAP